MEIRAARGDAQFDGVNYKQGSAKRLTNCRFAAFVGSDVFKLEEIYLKMFFTSEDFNAGVFALVSDSLTSAHVTKLTQPPHFHLGPQIKEVPAG